MTTGTPAAATCGDTFTSGGGRHFVCTSPPHPGEGHRFVRDPRDPADPSTQRDECIALEAASIAVRSLESRTTFSQIAAEAINKVDAAAATPGGLDALHASWSRDPDEVDRG